MRLPVPISIGFAALLLIAANYTGGFGGWSMFAAWASVLGMAASLGPAAWTAWRSPSNVIGVNSGGGISTALAIAVGLYAVALFVASALSTAPGVSSEVLFAMGLLPASYCLTRVADNAGCDWKSIWGLCRCFIAVLALLALFERLITGGRAYTLLADPNLLAGVFNAALLTTFATLAASYKSDEPRSLLRNIGLLLLFASAVGSTGSLSGFLCLCVALPTLCVFAARRQLRPAALQLVGLVFATLAITVLCSRGMAETPVEKLGGIAQHSSFTVRVEMAKASLAIYRDHAWHGTGLGTYKLFYPSYRGPLDTSTSGDLAHNDYVQFLQEGGPLLLGALLLLTAITLQATLSLVMKHWHEGLAKAQLNRLGAGAAVMALMLQAGMNFVFYSSFTSLLIGVLLAGITHKRKKREPLRSSPLLFFVSVFALSMGLVATSGARALFLSLIQNTCKLHVCNVLRSDPQFMKTLTTYLTATQPSWPAATEYVLNNHLQAEATTTDPQKKKEWRLRALKDLLELTALFPKQSGAFVTLVDLLKRDPTLMVELPTGFPSDQVTLLEIALANAPQSLPLRLRLTQALVDLSRLQDAYAVLFIDGMKHWNMYSWGDAGRMRLLTTAIPMAALLHRCDEAREMAAGLKVFINISKEAETKNTPLPPSLGVPTTSADEANKALHAAEQCG